MGQERRVKELLDAISCVKIDAGFLGVPCIPTLPFYSLC